jgi:hypothetical protein
MQISLFKTAGDSPEAKVNLLRACNILLLLLSLLKMAVLVDELLDFNSRRDHI